MIEPFTVLSSNVVVLDYSVYQLWLLGKTVDQAVAYRRQHLTTQASRKSVASAASSVVAAGEASSATQPTSQQPKPSPEPAVSLPVVRNYILTQYRTFELLEHYLHNPPYLADHFLLPMTKDMKAWLVER
ncbi:MAG: hypothetical protein BJ554DRAFT_3205 [Olpidium bornovanus]|uniref:Uncharacterized protein n=1 Tax=Olpidium bornovanus TaxID=278681 RepID=A0A8H7ZPV8_9FUNG|nr:MAG: hypothetical protein BJ554DRAFT_3205 [Olpidium bornovanus]